MVTNALRFIRPVCIGIIIAVAIVAAILGSKVGILGNSITEMKASSNHMWAKMLKVQ